METKWWTIVGVVGDVRQSSPTSPLAQTLYVPVAQHSFRASDMQIVVRTGIDPATMATSSEPILKRSYPQVAVSSTTMRDAVGESSRSQRFRTILFGGFAGVGILLSAVGMYGVTAYTVAQRRFEFALRFALGAQRSQIVTMTLSHGTFRRGILSKHHDSTKPNPRVGRPHRRRSLPSPSFGSGTRRHQERDPLYGRAACPRSARNGSQRPPSRF